MPKAYQMKMRNDGGVNSAEVNLYGEIVESVPVNWWTGKPVDGLFIELKGFLDDLERLEAMDSITFRINSIGGDVNAGIAIYNRIRELSAETTTIVDGIAASAASIVAQAGDRRIVNVGTQTMIHGASAFLCGYYNAKETKRVGKGLEAINRAVAGIYASHTGLGEERILSMMEAEKWMAPEDALADGFADEIAGKEAPEAEQADGAKAVYVNGILHALRGLPMPEMAFNKQTAGKPAAIDKITGKGAEKMNLEELKTEHPELVEQIRNEALSTARAEAEKQVAEALESDRARMKAIDSIAAQVGDPAMVEKAKYDEPATAEQLALVAMQAQAAAGTSFLAARSEEVRASGADGVHPAPVDGSEEDTRAKDIADGAALIAGQDWKGGN